MNEQSHLSDSSNDNDPDTSDDEVDDTNSSQDRIKRGAGLPW